MLEIVFTWSGDLGISKTGLEKGVCAGRQEEPATRERQLPAGINGDYRRAIMFKKGDKVWDIRQGWGIVTRIAKGNYPVHVKQGDDPSGLTYTSAGHWHEDDKYPSLFHDEIKFTVPPEPSREPALKPCPFCGGPVYLSSYSGSHVELQIACITCGVTTPQIAEAYRGILIEQWNTRV